MNPAQLLAFLQSIFEKGPKELPQRNPQAFDPGDDPLQAGRTPRPMRGFIMGPPPQARQIPDRTQDPLRTQRGWTPSEDLPDRVARPTPAGQARQGALLSALGRPPGPGRPYSPPTGLRA